MKRGILVFIFPLAIFIFLSIFYFWPESFVFWLAIFLIWLLLLLTFRHLFFPRFNDSFLFLGQLFLFVLTISFLPIFLGQNILFFFLLLSSCLLLYFYLRDIFQLLYQPRFYRPGALETTALPLNFVIILLLVTEAEMLVFVYHFSRLIIFPILFLSFFGLSLYYFTFKKTKTILLPAFVTALLLTEFYLVFSFLPLSGHLNGLILALAFVMIIKIWQKKEPKFI